MKKLFNIDGHEIKKRIEKALSQNTIANDEFSDVITALEDLPDHLPD